jgi:hypothetical protein
MDSTQNQTTHVYNETIGSNKFSTNFKTYLLNPISNGLAGFAAFFTLILLTNLFGYLLGTYNTFSLEINDVIYSLTGFVFGAGAKFLEFFGKED